MASSPVALRPAVIRRLAWSAILAGVAALAVAPLPRAMAAGTCREIDVPASLPDGKSTSVHGLLCEGSSQLKGVIQVFMAGATEGGLAYWDFPHPDFYEVDSGTYRPLRARYSYANYLADAGYASLTLDRIGTGESAYPPAHEVTIASNASVVDQVVKKLRGGDLGIGDPYQKVIGVGHSMGAVVAYVAAVDHGSFDGIIAQSFRRHQTSAFAEFPTSFAPAQSDPRLAGRPSGYFTTRPGTRSQFFQPEADAFVMAHEERLKDTVTSGEVATIGPSFDYSERVEGPVLSLVGSHDALFCATPACPEAETEAGFFPQAACFKSHVIQDRGHDMNLQPGNRTDVFPIMLEWVRSNFGSAAGPCQPSGVK